MIRDWMPVCICEALCVELFALTSNRKQIKKQIWIYPSFFGCYFFLQYLHANVWHFGQVAHFLCLVLLIVGFTRLWSQAAFTVCIIMGLLFAILGNCIWPLRQLFLARYFPDDPLWVRNLTIILFGLLECGFVCALRLMLPSMKQIRMNPHIAILFIMAIFPFFYFRVLKDRRYFSEQNLEMQVWMCIYSLLLVLVVAWNIGYFSKQTEKMAAERVYFALNQQREQFQKELLNADTVNMKYHDLKNILLYLESQEEKENNSSEARRLADEIGAYGNYVDTGNEAISIIINKKMDECLQKKITCQPFIDGTSLTFVDPVDLCVIFGNALDNAIESCEKIAEPEQRQISIKSSKRGNSVFLVFRNTFSERPVMRGDLPVSDKDDQINHGYGLRSIRCLVDKYNGTMKCLVEQDEFVLQLVLINQA